MYAIEFVGLIGILIYYNPFISFLIYLSLVFFDIFKLYQKIKSERILIAQLEDELKFIKEN